MRFSATPSPITLVITCAFALANVSCESQQKSVLATATTGSKVTVFETGNVSETGVVRGRLELSSLCSDLNVSNWELNNNLMLQWLRHDDGSEEYALGVLYTALTIMPPGHQRTSGSSAFHNAQRLAYQQRLDSAVETSIKYLREGRIQLSRQMVVEVDSLVRVAGSRSPKMVTQLFPVPLQAFERYTLDPAHPDPARRLFLFLALYRTADGQPLDMDLKTEHSLETSVRPLLMMCLDTLKLDPDFCTAIVNAGHDLRAYEAGSPTYPHERLTGGLPFDNGLTGGSFLHEVLVDYSVPIIKRIFGVFAHLRANPEMSLADALDARDLGQRTSWNGNIHTCIPQILCVSPTARELVERLWTTGIIPDRISTAESIAMESDLTLRLLKTFFEKPHFDRRSLLVHQPTRSTNVLHLIALSNNIQALETVLTQLLPAPTEGRWQDQQDLVDVQQLLAWKEHLMDRTPLHMSGALFGTGNPVYLRLRKLDEELFEASTSTIRDALGLLHSDYSANHESLVFRQMRLGSLSAKKLQLSNSIVATADQSGEFPFRGVVALHADTVESNKPTVQINPDVCVNSQTQSGCLLGDSRDGGWGETTLPADIAQRMPRLNSAHCDVLELDSRDGPPTAAELSAYVAQSRPIMFRGGARKWSFRKKWTREQFVGTYGQKKAQVSSIPYASSFNYGEKEMTLEAWVQMWEQGAANSTTEVAVTSDLEVAEVSTPGEIALTHPGAGIAPTYLFSTQFVSENPGLKADA